MRQAVVVLALAAALATALPAAMAMPGDLLAPEPALDHTCSPLSTGCPGHMVCHAFTNVGLAFELLGDDPQPDEC